MDRFFDSLYSQFLLRDLLAKVVPGLISLYAALSLFIREPESLLAHLARTSVIQVLVIAYGLSFMVMLLLQFLAERIGLISIFVWRKKSEKRIVSVKRSLAKARAFELQNDGKDLILRQRERFVVLKEMAGNYGISLLLLAIAVFARLLVARPRAQLWLLCALTTLIAAGIVLLWQNRSYAEEQLIWEGGDPEAIAGDDEAAA